MTAVLVGALGPIRNYFPTEASPNRRGVLQEEAQYLARSLKAAVNSGADLVACERAGCEGAAVAGTGAFSTRARG